MSTIEDFQSATFAAIPHDLTVAAVPHEDLTVGEAWASSPLGDPSIEDGFLSEPARAEDFAPTTVTAEDPADAPTTRSWGTTALVAGAALAGVGVIAGLGLMFLDGSWSNQPKPAVVVPNSNVSSVAPQGPSAVAPPPVAPAPPSIATPPEAAQLPAAPVSGGDVPVVPVPVQVPAAGPAPAVPDAPADPGTPPPPPNVTVNIPPVVVPVPIPVPVPSDHDGDQPGSGTQQGGTQQGGGTQQNGGNPPVVHGPIECLACQPHPVQQQPIHPQPVQQQPVHPPVQQQPIQPHPIQQQPIQQHH